MTAVGVPVAHTGSDRKMEEGSRWAGLSGVLFAILLIVSFVMTFPEPAAKNAAKVQTWDLKHSGLLNGSTVVSVVGVIVGLYFLTWLYSQLTRDGAGWMGALYLVGVAVFAVSGGVSAGISAVVGADAKHLSTDSLQLMASLNQSFGYAITVSGLAVMYLGAGFLIRRSGVLPGWLAWVSWVFALLAATFVLGFVSLLGTVLWVIAVGAILTARPAAGR